MLIGGGERERENVYGFRLSAWGTLGILRLGLFFYFYFFDSLDASFRGHGPYD